jgi:thioesterase domain-containing protein
LLRTYGRADQKLTWQGFVTDVVDMVWVVLDHLYSPLKLRLDAARSAASDEAAQDQDEVTRKLGQLTDHYLATARPYDGEVILFRARVQPWFAAYNRSMGWERMATGGVQVEQVRGAHLSILKRHFVAPAADRLRQALARLDAKTGGRKF